MAQYLGETTDRVRGERAYRVDSTSNYSDETYCEKVILTHLTRSQAERIADIMNEGHSTDLIFYQPRPHGHKLWQGMSELV